MKRFYTAIRGKVTSPGPARPVFRSNTDMMLLTTRLRLDPNGKPHISRQSGRLEKSLHQPSAGQVRREADQAAAELEGRRTMCSKRCSASRRKAVENEPLKIFMALSDVERNRATPLAAETVDRLARDYRTMRRAVSTVFVKLPRFPTRPSSSSSTPRTPSTRFTIPLLRADAAGTMQGLAGLWQIFVRQGSIAPPTSPTSARRASLTPFEKIQNEREVFDGGRGGVKVLLEPPPIGRERRLAAGPHDRSSGRHRLDRSSDAHQQVVEDMIRVLRSPAA